MKDSEARRKQLLYETRNLYRDDGRIPAVHPRYRAAHSSLYPDGESVPKSSLKLRILFSIVCFICYLAVDYGKIAIAHLDSTMIHEQIARQMQLNEISEVLNNYEKTGTFR